MDNGCELVDHLSYAGIFFNSSSLFVQRQRFRNAGMARTTVRRIGLHPVLKTPSLVFLWNREVGHGETEVHTRVQA